MVTIVAHGKVMVGGSPRTRPSGKTVSHRYGEGRCMGESAIFSWCRSGCHGPSPIGSDAA